MNKLFVCKLCHQSFERHVYPSSIKNKTFEFCSPICRNKSRALKPTEKCKVCGTMFKPGVIDTGGVRRKYCSAECANYSRRGKNSTNPYTHSEYDNEFTRQHYPRMGADWVAEKLGYTKSAIANLANRLHVVLDKDVYRSRVHGAAKKYMTGEKNPNWRGGGTLLEWGSNWKEQQKKTRQRDDYCCQVCGYRSRHISVHHIKPRRFFLGHMEDSNVLSNLICLCGSHHLLVEIGKVPCPKPKS